MTSKATASSQICKRYANALIDLAQHSEVLDKVEKDMVDIRAMLSSSEDMRTLVESPLISRSDQESALHALSKKAKLQTLSSNFLGVLAQNRRLNLLGEMIVAFFKSLAERRGEVDVHVLTAHPLSAKQKSALQDALSKVTTGSVNLENETDESVLGGMVVTVGSFMIDDSVARKLEQLRNEMQRNVQNQEAA